jgi:hypothetical protein
MSYSDTFDNEFVGYFGGIPVYHPLEVVPALSDDGPLDFACGPENLLIGGGSGEHPGIVVKAPSEAVHCFVRAWLAEENPYLSPEERQAIGPAVTIWEEALSGRRRTRDDWRDVFEFAGWKAADYVKFSARCASGAFHRPFDPGKDDSLEQWLAESVGEFILCAMPELAQDAVEQLGDLRRHVAGCLYRNLLLVPPGYPVWGRREIDSNVTWGVSAWRIEREQHPWTIRG